MTLFTVYIVEQSLPDPGRHEPAECGIEPGLKEAEGLDDDTDDADFSVGIF